MRAIQIDSPKHLRMIDTPKPIPEEGQVLVRNQRISICGTDMRSFRKVAPEETYPFPSGQPCHECVGVVDISCSKVDAVALKPCQVISSPGIPMRLIAAVTAFPDIGRRGDLCPGKIQRRWPVTRSRSRRMKCWMHCVFP